MNEKETRLILASASPRRRELLAQIGIFPEIVPSTVEEHPEGDTPEEVVTGLAEQKALDVAERFSDGELVIGADTVVACDGRILGKPKTHEEAAEMIRLLSGKAHQVFTGVALVRAKTKTEPVGIVLDRFCEKTDVHVCPMDEEEILRYAVSEEPMDKAGSYGIQGSFAAYVSGISGDYNNVVGLPVSRLYRALKEQGIPLTRTVPSAGISRYSTPSITRV